VLVSQGASSPLVFKLQIIHLSLQSCITFCNMLVLYGKMLVPTLLPSSGTHLAGYLKLLIEYTCRYPPHLDVLSSCNLKTYHTVVTKGNNNNINICCTISDSQINKISACCFVMGRNFRLSQRQERWLSMLDNRMLRMISEPKRKEITGSW
jgi:hypothetical protein